MGKVGTMRRSRAAAVLAVAILAAGLLTACGSSHSSSSTGSASSGNATSTPAASTSTSASGGKTTIGYLYKLPNPYFNAMTAAVKQWAAQNNINLLVGGGQTPTDVAGQMSAVQTMISQGAKAIVIAPEGPQLLPTLQRAIAQSVPVVLVDGDLPTFTQKTSYVGTDNYKGALLAGQFIRAHLKSGDKIAIESGVPGVPTLDQRVQGVIDALKGSGISIVANLPNQCLEPQGVSVTQDILTAHPDIQGIYFACSPPVFGAQQVLAQRNLTKKLMIVGFDGDPQEYKDIKAGTETATVAQFPRKMGIIALQLALKAIAGKTVPKKVDSGQSIVSASNVGQYNGWQ